MTRNFNQQFQVDPNLRRIRSKFESICADCFGIIDGPTDNSPGEEIYYNIETRDAHHINCYTDLKQGKVDFLTGERTAPRFQMESEPERDDRQGDLEFDPVHAASHDHVITCQDDDIGCPFCNGACERNPVELLTRVDNPDRKLKFCTHCAIDAKESGKWTNEQEDEPLAMIADLRIALDKEIRENNKLKMASHENGKLKEIIEKKNRSIQLLAARITTPTQ